MSERIALDQWPHDIDPVLQEAFDIALDYLEFTGQAFPFQETQEECARIVIDEWAAGRKHRIWLANKAVAAIELKRQHNAGNGNVTTLTTIRR
jgi:hypothetical protein